MTLKDKTKEIKKLQTLQKKLEDRYKDKVKQLKDCQKEKLQVEDFLRSIIPHLKFHDKEGKWTIDQDKLTKLHSEQFVKHNPSLQTDMNRLRDDNDQIKKKI